MNTSHIYSAYFVATRILGNCYKTESAIFISLVYSLFPEYLRSELILCSLQMMLYRVAALKRLLVHHDSADCIFLVFCDFWLILSQFENRVPLKPVLGGVGSVALLHDCT